MEKAKVLRTRVITAKRKKRAGLISEPRLPVKDAVEGGVRTFRDENHPWLVDELPAWLERARASLRAAGLPEEVTVEYLWKPDGTYTALTETEAGEDGDLVGNVFAYLRHRDPDYLTDEYLASRALFQHEAIRDFAKAGNPEGALQHALMLGWMLREWQFRLDEHERMAVAGRGSQRNLTKNKGEAGRKKKQQTAQMNYSEAERCAREIWAATPSLRTNASATADEIIRRKGWEETRHRRLRDKVAGWAR